MLEYRMKLQYQERAMAKRARIMVTTVKMHKNTIETFTNILNAKCKKFSETSCQNEADVL